MGDANIHIIDYLKYYCDLAYSPRYAVMLSGKWGAGKTHLLDDFISHRLENRTYGNMDETFIRISLYGIMEYQEIEDTIFQQLHPLLGSKAVKFVGSVLRASLKTAVKIDIPDGDSVTVSTEVPNINLSKYISKLENIVLIFDDLERCGINIVNILGYINHFVEKDGCKVIIIGNESEIDESLFDKYKKIKEKIIGMTLLVEPNYNDALRSFIDDIKSDDPKNFIDKHKDNIGLLFQQSETKNLRILQQSIRSFSRLYMIFEPKHRSHDDIMLIIMSLMICLELEIRAGKLDEQTLSNLGRRYWISQRVTRDGTPDSPSLNLRKKYPQVQFDQTYISPEDISNILTKGFIDKNNILSSINKHREFSDPDKEQPWRIIWDAAMRPQNIIDRSLSKLDTQLKNHEIVHAGIILHVFGIKLWLRKSRTISDTRSQILDQAKSYIDKIYELKKLEILPIAMSGSILDATLSFDGLGFHQSKSLEFRKMAEHLTMRLQDAVRREYPSEAKNIVRLMLIDPDEFFELVAVDSNNPKSVRDKPIFHFINVKLFVRLFLRMPKYGQYRVLDALFHRYDSLAHHPNLLAEIEWIRALRSRLHYEANKMPPIARYAMRSWIKRSLRPPLFWSRNLVERLSREQSGE